mgnify:CR=1 FL=1
MGASGFRVGTSTYFIGVQVEVTEVEVDGLAEPLTAPKARGLVLSHWIRELMASAVAFVMPLRTNPPQASRSPTRKPEDPHHARSNQGSPHY